MTLKIIMLHERTQIIIIKEHIVYDSNYTQFQKTQTHQ